MFNTLKHPHFERITGSRPRSSFTEINAVQYPIQLAKVKDVNDVTRSGKIRVWLCNSGTNEQDESNWFTVNYCSPFAAHRDLNRVSSTQTRVGSLAPQTYGFWAPVTDVENFVLVVFVDNDPVQGYWIGSPIVPGQNYMLPGTAEAQTFDGGDPKPATEQNPYDPESVSPNPRRPSEEILSRQLEIQGLHKNQPIRGAGTSSAARENVSQVIGIRSRGGSVFVMDDKPGSELIRLRTKSGVQMVISETTGHIYFITKNGNAWIEIRDDGHIDIFGMDSLNIAVKKDINLTAERDLNIDIKRNLNVKIGGNTKIETNDDIRLKTDGNVRSEIKKDFDARILQAAKILVEKDIDLKTLEKLRIEGKENIDIKTDKEFVVESGEDTHLRSGKKTFFTSKETMNLFSEEENLIMTAQTIHLNGPQADSATTADSAQEPEQPENPESPESPPRVPTREPFAQRSD